MMTVCRLCLVASNDVIHIFREVGVQLKVSSILSKHFGSLFEVTEEHDEAICAACWSHTESFHTFYQSIKSAQNCYSSDEEDGGGVIMTDTEHHQLQPQNVKLVMYDSVTGQVIEQVQQNDHRYHITYNNNQTQQQQQQQHQQQHQQQQQHDQIAHVIDQETYEVCDETTDSDLELLMMMQPHESSGSDQPQQQQSQHHIQQQQQHQDEQMSDHIIQIAEDDDDDRMEESTGMAPILHIRDRSNSQLNNEVDDSVSEFLHSNEHITVIEVSSASQAQKLLQQQQLQQQQQHHVQQQHIVQPPQHTPKPATTIKQRRPPVARKRKLPSEVNVITTVQKQHTVPVISSVVSCPAAPASLSEEVAASPQKSNTSMVSTFENSPTSTTKAGEPSVAEPYRMQCDLCSKTFKTFHRVQSHYQLKHNMDGYVMCCGDQFFEKDLLVDHILMHVNNRRQMKKISCAYCEQFFYRKRFYTRHLWKVHSISANGNSRNESLNSSTSSTTSPSTATTPVRAATASAPINVPHSTTFNNMPGVQVVRQIGQPVKVVQKLVGSTPVKTVISSSGSVIKHEAQPDDELLILGS